MLLVPGTTLNNGKYVIDALLEDADNGALYWGTQVDTDSPVYIQAGRIQPQTQDSVEDAVSDTGPTPNLLPSSQASSHPCCSGILETFIDSQQSYLAMATQLGQPWSHRHRYSGPLPPKQALIRVEQAVTGLLWLMDQGIPAVDFSPNRIWWPDDDAPVILSGWLEPLPQGEAFNPLSAMATLLWQFLSGSTLKPPTTIADLQQQHPSLSPQILHAIQFGLTASPPPEAAPALTTWLQSLPMPNGHTALTRPESEPNPPSVETPSPNDAPLAHPPSTTRLGEAPATPALAQARSTSPPFSPGLALALTALMAALAGVGAGMAWRFAPGAQTPGGPRFSPDQGFPTLSNWSGDSPMKPISPVRPRSRDIWEQAPESSGFPEPGFPESGLITPPDSLERFPDRWPTPADPWEPLEGNGEGLEPTPRRDRQTPEPLPSENTPQATPSPLSGQDATLEEDSQPETPSTDPPPIINPNPAETAPSPEVTPAPAPVPDLPTAES